jgi:hypothetical protein
VLTPYLARAEGREAAAHGADRRPRADTVAAPDPGATDEPNANGGAPSAPDPTNSPAVGFVQLLPDVAIKCVADRRRHGSDVRNARLLCAEVRPRVRGRHRGRPIFDGFWG